MRKDTMAATAIATVLVNDNKQATRELTPEQVDRVAKAMLGMGVYVNDLGWIRAQALLVSNRDIKQAERHAVLRRMGFDIVDFGGFGGRS
jgi:hypothetical protein